ncbi:MAG: helix-turn-helix domain-containing protein [Planctomycetota bacterium]
MSDTPATITAWPALLDRETLAAYLSVSATTLNQLRNSGRLGPREHEFGKRCPRWSRVEVDQWIAAGCPNRAQWVAQRVKAIGGAA